MFCLPSLNLRVRSSCLKKVSLKCKPTPGILANRHSHPRMILFGAGIVWVNEKRDHRQKCRSGRRCKIVWSSY
jgi:hypothetical protein